MVRSPALVKSVYDEPRIISHAPVRPPERPAPAPARLLELQHTAGNRYVTRLLNTRLIQRVERELLWPDQLVHFTTKATLEPGAIEVEKGTRGKVSTVPTSGPVDVRLLDGQHVNTSVKADPAQLDFPPSGPLWEERAEAWGWVWVVGPGIGVELVIKKTDNKEQKLAEGQAYAKFVQGEVGKMAQNRVGHSMLDQFDPGRLGGTMKKVDKQDGPFRGLTVVIGAKDDNIETTDMAGRSATGGGVFSGTRIPRVNFPMPRPGQEVPIPKSHPAKLTEGGVKGHLDSPDTLQPLHLVLYHEFAHAYLKQIGVADRLRLLGAEDTPGIPKKITKVLGVRVNPEGDYSDAIEEELVVGLHGAGGLPFGENAYRCGAGTGQRHTYTAVGVEADPEVSNELQIRAAAAPPTIYEALIKLGATPQQAAYIVRGELIQ